MFEQFADDHYFGALCSLVVAVALTALCAVMILMLQKVTSNNNLFLFQAYFNDIFHILLDFTKLADRRELNITYI